MKTKLLNDNIAIVGMACTFPGAHSPKELWQNVLAGRRYFRKLPDERLPSSLYFHEDPTAPGKSYCDQAALISDWRFDPIKYRLAPVTVNASDLTHWLALDTAARAVKDSGLVLTKENTSRIGCIIGNSLGGEFARSHNLRLRSPYLRRVLTEVFQEMNLSNSEATSFIEEIENHYNAPFPEVTEDTLAGNMSNTIVGRICNHFNLGGGGYTIDGACSSSLLALAHAANALLNGDMDVVLTGGVDISLDPFEVVGFAKTKALSTDDIKVYDKNANGMLPGEGCGIVVLMKEQEAIKKGLSIHALLKGWGYSTDGRGGITAPKASGQARAIEKAYAMAGYDISSIGLIEGHGTGTALGDKIELQAIQQVIEHSQGEGQIGIGSIKSNIGHCKAAAGVAGLIKVVMALKQKILPATTNCIHPNKLFNPSLKPILKNKFWKKGNTPRRASVSAMGFGGSNSHITLEEYIPPGITSSNSENLKISSAFNSSELMPLSGVTAADIQQAIKRLLPISQKISRAELSDVSAALCKKETKGDYRIAFLVKSPWELSKQLSFVLDQMESNLRFEKLHHPERGIFAGIAKENPKCVFLFPGQGSQSLNSGAALLQRFPEFAKLCDEIKLPDPLLDYFIKDTIGVAEESIAKWEEQLKQTAIAQPAIVFTSLLFKKVLDQWNLKADLAIGHSLGEITAMCSAGAYPEKNAVELAMRRGKVMQNLQLEDGGKMAVLFGSAELAVSLIEKIDGPLNIANYNSEKQTVISGSSKAIDAFIAHCNSQNVFAKTLKVSHAFHSPIVTPASESFKQEIKDIPFAPLNGKVMSTVTGNTLAKETDLVSYFCEQISKPVKFMQAVHQAKQHIKPDLWIEVGSGNILSSLVEATLDPAPIHCYSTAQKGSNDFFALNQVFAAAFILGFPLDTKRLFDNRFFRPIDLENYAPHFITNPCERKIPLPQIRSKSRVFENQFKPINIEGKQWQDYLKGRKQFLQSFIELDYQHFLKENVKPAPKPLAAPKTIEKKEAVPSTEVSSTLDFAITWIAKRTGFPQSAISPEMKLRDDLSLDSIKATELILLLSEKLGIKSRVDPQPFSNQSLAWAIDKIEYLAANQNDHSSLMESLHSSDKHWIKTFPMSWIKVPLNTEEVESPKADLNICLFNPYQIESEKVWKTEFKKNNLQSLYLDHKNLPSDVFDQKTKTIVFLLPELANPFSGFDPEQYTLFLEKQAKLFFDFFKTLAASKQINDARCIILSRHTSFDDQEVSAPYAALKSFILEQDNWTGKWLQIAASIPREEMIPLLVKEIKDKSKLAFIRYEDKQNRLAWGAEQSLPPLANGLQKHLNTNDLSNSTLLVTGGGKGITFELALAFAKTYANTTLILVGRTKAEDLSPELSKNLSRLKKEKIDHLYRSCDITNLAEVKILLKHIKESYGKLGGILHGSGISKLNPILHKEWSEFWNCMQVKALGLYNILSEIDVDQLRFLHVLSSIIGKTGMQGQLDYAYTNAWLDGVVEKLAGQYPHLQTLSLGYSVWSEVGIGEKLGAVKRLKQLGINAIAPQEGIAAYLQLVQQKQSFNNFIILGRLPSHLEEGIYISKPDNNYRFIDKIISWVPDTALTIETEISTERDWYLLEHIFEGSIIFPGVMALEAMTQVAQQLAGKKDFPLINNIQFFRPLLISPDKKTTISIKANHDGQGRIKVRLFGGRAIHNVLFEAEFSFEQITSQEKMDLSHHPALAIDVEALSPKPLFQGKMFRRITAILKMEKGKESIVELSAPSHISYFNDAYPHESLSMPALQDAFLQAGLLVLPSRSLPSKIGSIRLYRFPKNKERIFCKVQVHEYSDTKCISSLAVYDSAGNILEAMNFVETNVPTDTPHKQEVASTNKPIKRSRLVNDFDALTPYIKTGLHLNISNGKNNLVETFVPQAPLGRSAVKETSAATLNQAILKLSEKFKLPVPSLDDTKVKYTKNGKPILCFENGITHQWHLSLSDSDRSSVAIVSDRQVGIDIEQIESRNSEQWIALLEQDVYHTALKLSIKLQERFDYSATRLWAMKEAVFKATGLGIPLIKPQYECLLGGPWVFYSVHSEAIKIEIYSTLIIDEDAKVYAVAIAIKP